jgi:hypothetical protein
MSIRHPVWPCIMLATDQINCVPYAPICIRRLIQSNNEPRAQRMRRFSFATYPSKKKLSLEWCPLLIHLFFFFWIVDFLCFLSFSVKSFLVDRNVLLEKLFFFWFAPSNLHPFYSICPDRNQLNVASSGSMSICDIYLRGWFAFVRFSDIMSIWASNLHQ